MQQGQWSTTSTSHWQADAPVALRADALPATAEVVVVGGGLLGACTLYRLAHMGVAAVLLEQVMPAFGATGRNGGFMVAGTAESYDHAIKRVGHDAARAIWQITLDSRALLRQALEEDGISCAYREPGRLNIALTDEHFAGIKANIAAMHADGFEAYVLDRTQVQELVNTPLGPEIVGGLFAKEDGLLQPALFIQGLLAAAQRRGAKIVPATVTQLSSVQGRVSIQTSVGPIETASAVVAVNAWASQLVPALTGIITPVRGQVLSYEPVAPVFRAGMGAAVTPTGEYWHQTPNGAIVLGGCRAVAPGGEVGVLEEGTTPEVQAALEGVFPRLFPELGGLQVARRWSGPMAFTRDYLPVCDRAPELDGAWVVGGFCGHGMPFGMRLGQLLAEAATSGIKPEALAPLRVDRPTLKTGQ